MNDVKHGQKSDPIVVRRHQAVTRHMSDAVADVVTTKSQVPLWAAIIGSFALASCVQILFYGAPTLLEFGGYHLPEWLYEPVVLSFFFAPATIAFLVSLRLLRSAARNADRRLSAPPIVAISILAVLSAYMGVFVSFNTWGT